MRKGLRKALRSSSSATTSRRPRGSTWSSPHATPLSTGMLSREETGARTTDTTSCPRACSWSANNCTSRASRP
eukprot:2316457-Rhodomonas_salina.1